MTKPPFWFFMVSSVALVWNLMGILAIGINLSMTPEQIATLSAAQQEQHAATPLWLVFASIVAVLSGTIGCLMLLLKKRIAHKLFILSLVAIIVQDFALFVIFDTVLVLGIGPLIMQSAVFLIALGLIFMATHSINRQWIR